MAASKYEGMFVLDTAGKEEGIKELVDKVQEEIQGAGGKVLSVQKMDKRTFSRETRTGFGSGYYANYVFELDPGALKGLNAKIRMNEMVIRHMISHYQEPKKAAATTNG